MIKLTSEEILSRIQSAFTEGIVEAYESFGMLTVVFKREINIELLSFLKQDKDLNFHFLTDLCAVHYPDRENEEMGMIYHLHNFFTGTRIRLECFFPIADPTIRTIIPLWNSANWQERETFDFYGVIFEGHPDLRRIVNVDEMDYFPQLKQYPLEDAVREDKNDAMFGR